MPKELLTSQFTTLEEPQQELIVAAADTPQALVAIIRKTLQV